jgi:hypothetical protein
MLQWNSPSIHNSLLSLKSYMFQLYETSNIRPHNSEIQKGNYTAIAVKTYGRNLGLFTVKCMAMAIWFPFIFLKHEAWWWLFHTAETCSFLDLIQCCVWTDCPIGTYCIDTMAMTHIKTGSQFYIFLHRILQVYNNHATGWMAKE